MMWTPHSPHVHVTCPPSGSRGYVFLQGVARLLSIDHSLSISKTMSRRRSHNLPRPNLGCLVPDQAYLVPDQVYLVLNQVVHIPKIEPWQNHPLNPLDRDYNIVPKLTQ